MPTFDATALFWRQFDKLSAKDRKAFLKAVELFVAGLEKDRVDPRLRVKRVQKAAGVWELSWAPDGRATFHFGQQVKPGHPRIVWRRIGTHSILERDP